jgi:membrane associated rhomboid family serine protease
MTAPVPPSSAPERASLVTPVVAWLVGGMLAMHFLRWTVLQPEVLIEAFGFRRGDLDVGRWWSVATYALVHPSATTLVMSAYVLLLFGPRLERFWGSRRLAGFVAFAALGGWIVHLFIGGEAPLLGGASVALGVLGAHAIRWGYEERLLVGGFTARVRWLAAVVAAIVLLVGLQEPVGGGVPFVAHLGGLATAWFFARATSVLLVERFREGVSAMPDEPPEDQPPRAVPRTLPRSRSQRETIDDVVARTNAEAPRRRASSRREAPRATATEAPPPSLDAILDKISAEGLDRLSPAERQVLDDHSRRLRDA